MKPPHVQGAMISGPAAYALARVLDPRKVADDLADKGYDNRWRDLARLAIDAIHIEAARWRSDAKEHLARAASARGPEQVPKEGELSSSQAMESITTSQAANILGVSSRRVRTLAARGDIPGKRSGRDWRLEGAAVAALATERKAA